MKIEIDITDKDIADIKTVIEWQKQIQIGNNNDYWALLDLDEISYDLIDRIMHRIKNKVASSKRYKDYDVDTGKFK
jgi:hypothetical protein